MSFIKHAKNIFTLLFYRRYPENIVLFILYMEKVSIFPFRVLFKILRYAISHTIFHVEMPPYCFTVDAIMTLRLPHAYMIIIHGDVRIGENARIFHQVTIGHNESKDDNKAGVPLIGNNVYIGANTTIIGKVNIVDNKRIGANSLIYKDME